MSDELAFIGLALVAGMFGFGCRHEGAAKLFWFVAFVSLTVGVAFAAYSGIDLSACKGNLMKGIQCPPEISKSFEFEIAKISFAVWFFGMFLVVFLGGPLAFMAVVLELVTRWRQR